MERREQTMDQREMSRERREESTGAGGCLVAVLAAGTGFGVWLYGARPGLRGRFEGQRDWSLLYADLPFMLIGMTAITLAAWALTRVALRGRLGRGTRTVVLGSTVVLVLTALAWVSLAWLAGRVDWVSPE
jgi:hypothetical protein